jgi:hypothetical protein
MQVEFTAPQIELLRAVLDAALRDLRYEIADTDLPADRRMLRERRTTLEEMLERVGGPITDAERFG